MANYSGQVTRSFGYDTEYVSVVPNSGVSVQIEISTGDGWVDHTESPATTNKEIIATGLTLRFTPTGGTFFVTDGEAV